MSILDAAIGWLAPPQCLGCGLEGSALCVACLAAEIIPYGAHCFGCGAVSPDGRTCPKCRKAGTPRSVWVSTNYEGLARNLVKKYKFGHQRIVAETLAELMADTFLAFNSQAGAQKANYLAVPVPTATHRVRRRSFDHAAWLARAIAKKLGLENSQVLNRLGQTQQVGALRATRLNQTEGNYFIRYAYKVKGRNILLIDDVVTTGATLRAATKALRAAGARHVDALVFAKRL